MQSFFTESSLMQNRIRKVCKVESGSGIKHFGSTALIGGWGAGGVTTKVAGGLESGKNNTRFQENCKYGYMPIL